MQSERKLKKHIMKQIAIILCPILKERDKHFTINSHSEILILFFDEQTSMAWI